MDELKNVNSLILNAFNETQNYFNPLNLLTISVGIAFL
jgi:hypothetical protein